MTSWAAWLGLGLALANLSVWAFAFVVARSLVARYRATFEPYLSLFTSPNAMHVQTGDVILDPETGEPYEVVLRLDEADMN